MKKNQLTKKKNDWGEVRPLEKCPYCHSGQVIKMGIRHKKHEKVQVFFCKHCQKKFTPLVTRHRKYPVVLILKSLILFNRFLDEERVAELIKKQYGLEVLPRTIAGWVKEYEDYQAFLRMRDFFKEQIDQKKTKFHQLIQESRLFHQQIYDFKYHRAKTDALIKEDYKNYKLKNIKDFLELIIAECPHQIFKSSGKRSSEYKDVFDLEEVQIIQKNNRACEMAKFVTQAVANNKERHQRLQEFMFFCDSVTIGVEVPILLNKEDVEHYRLMLNFDVPLTLEDDENITGHIDIIQLRNGVVHIMDYKPSAAKVKPVEQLTIYALALSRLTSLRLYNFKCAWFDDEDYYEFYPLHVVYKKKKKKKKSRMASGGR